MIKETSKNSHSRGIKWQHFISPASFLLALLVTAILDGAKGTAYTASEILKAIALLGTASGIPTGIYGLRHGWSKGASIMNIILGALIPGTILVGVIVAVVLLGSLVKAGY